VTSEGGTNPVAKEHAMDSEEGFLAFYAPNKDDTIGIFRESKSF
jgi:hypothetical protein